MRPTVTRFFAVRTGDFFERGIHKWLNCGSLLWGPTTFSSLKGLFHVSYCSVPYGAKLNHYLRDKLICMGHFSTVLISLPLSYSALNFQIIYSECDTQGKLCDTT